MNFRAAATAPAFAALALVSLLGGCGLASHSSGITPQPRTLPGTGSSLATAGGWLSEITAPSASAAWAVGNSCAPGCGIGSGAERTLVLRWNGTAWSQAPSPSPGGQAVLNAVSAGPDRTAWAVGYSCASGCGTGSETDKILILRWNGTAWSRAASPVVQGDLNSVSAGADGAAWAVGYSCAPGCGTTSETDAALILRWNGTAWSQQPKINGAMNADLLSVRAGADGAAWAVGYSCASGCDTTSEIDDALILRWNGSTWSRTPSPTRHHGAVLAGVAAAPDGTAWAVGKYCTSGCGTGSETDDALILRWNGSTWSRTPSPSPRPVTILAGVAVAPGGAAWAVGVSCASGCGVTSETDRTLILRWNGSTWSRTPSPSPRPVTILAGVAVAPGGGAWAAGVSCVSACGTASQQVRAVIFRWDGRLWTAAGP